MKERPILFSGPMVRAILEGRKTQTRRVVKPQPHQHDNFAKPGPWWPHKEYAYRIGTRPMVALCPHGVPGDRLWVRETWAWPGEEEVLYRASHQHIQDKMRSDPMYPQFVWRPSIFMRRYHSRITLEVTGVRVERLLDISGNDAVSEGVEEAAGPDIPLFRDYVQEPTERGRPDFAEWFADPRDSFRTLWSSINGAESWAANPWVWVVEFKRVEAKSEAA
jgi:hypothetical protein